jgi:hypothetical protein
MRLAARAGMRKAKVALARKRIGLAGTGGHPIPRSPPWITRDARARINVQPVSLDQLRALQQLRQGEIDAIVYVAKSPARLFFDLNGDDGVHFVPVPFTEEVSRIYLPARLAPADYPLLIGGGEAGRGMPIATIAVPIVLAVNSRALETEGNRDISQLMEAASARAIAQQGSSSGPTSRPQQAMEVPGWRHFVPTEGRLKSATGGESGSARTQSTPQRALQGTQYKKEVARLSPYSQQQRFSAEPRQSDEQRLNNQAESGNSTPDTTAGRARIAKQREALLREFLRWREQFSLSHKQPPQAAEDVFDEFMRSRGKR